MAKFSDEVVSVAVQGRRAVKRYPFPGVDGAECGVRMLTDDEIDTLRLNAVNYCKSKQVDLHMDPDFLDRTIQRLTVFHAFVDPDKPGEKYFEDLGDVMGLDGIMVLTLYQLYLSHQQSMDPLAYVSEEEVDALIAQLGKPGNAEGRLSLFDRRSLLSFVLSMASMLRATRPAPR